MAQRPTLLHACARAATAAEARFRIDEPIVGPRAVRVVALDDGAAAVTRRVAAGSWSAAQFYSASVGASRTNGHGGGAGDAVSLWSSAASSAPVDQVVGEAEVVVMVATEDTGARTAGAIGDFCARHGIMTIGIVLSEGGERGQQVVTAMRPHARVLLVSADADDLSDVLLALRA